MRTNATRFLVAAASCLVLAGCGGGTTSAVKTVTVTNTVTAPGTAESGTPSPSQVPSGFVTTGPTYTDPDVMAQKLNAGGFSCRTNPGAVPQLNLAGALRLDCFHGSENGTILLTWASPMDENAEKDQGGVAQNRLSYYGDGWAIVADTPADLPVLTKILNAG